MKNQEAFVYCWTDHKTNMLYVGYHKGSQDDGYVCSQPLMFEQYKERPMDFTRMILAEGTTEDCRKLEETILASADAKHSKKFYNQSNGNADFVCKGFTKKSIEKMSKSKKGKPLTKINREGISLSRKKYYKDHPEAKQSSSKTLKTLWEKDREKMLKICSEANKGKKLAEEWRKNMSIAQTGRKHNKETRKKMSVSATGHYVSNETIQKMSASLKGRNAHNKNKIAYNNGKNIIYIFKSATPPNGYKKGNGNFGVKSGMYGKIWITNGVVSTTISKGLSIPDGFREGRIIMKKNT